MAKSVLDVLDFSASGEIILPGTAPAAEGKVRWDTTNDRCEIYDGQRARGIGDDGWAPYAFVLGAGPAELAATAQTLAANGGSVAVPIDVRGHMLLQSLTIRTTDTSLQRTAEWRLYRQRLNNGNGGENTLDEVVNANGSFNYTPSAAANQTSTPSIVPIYLQPGIYWLVLRNTSPSNRTMAVGSAAAGTMALNICQTKTLGSALGTTLDFVAATWTKATFLLGARLNGRVFGQTASF